MRSIRDSFWVELVSSFRFDSLVEPFFSSVIFVRSRLEDDSSDDSQVSSVIVSLRAPRLIVRVVRVVVSRSNFSLVRESLVSVSSSSRRTSVEFSSELPFLCLVVVRVSVSSCGSSTS